MDAGGYTYVLIDLVEEQRWYAGPVTAISVGDVVQTTNGMSMGAFTSKTLNRTFDDLYFVGTLDNLSATPAMPEDQPAAALPPGHPTTTAGSGDAEQARTDTAVNAVEEGKDIAWVYANKDSLAGQSVRLRGKVVKYNANILGTNFLHIQDGSGDAANSDNDLIVTTNTEVAVGQTVVATGNIVLDKDFGAGYSYPVLLENAAITID
jgi:hypothetical protein